MRSAVIDIILSFQKTKKHKNPHSQDVVQQGLTKKQEELNTLTCFGVYIGKKIKMLVLESTLRIFFYEWFNFEILIFKLFYESFPKNCAFLDYTKIAALHSVCMVTKFIEYRFGAKDAEHFNIKTFS
ncbi:hypothetical protein V3565_02785 [Bartonella sp. B10]